MELLCPGVVSRCEARLGSASRPLLVIVEGRNDVEFLKRLASVLRAAQPDLPDLEVLEQAGRLIFVPFGGGNVAAWTNRFRPLGCAEFHLYDRECEPDTTIRHQAANIVNRRAGCQAFVTRQRSLENYLHPQAIVDAGGPLLSFAANESVPELYARAFYEQESREVPWPILPRRSRQRWCTRIKRWLCDQAVLHMTLARLRDRDRTGEIVGWLTRIGSLVDSTAVSP